MQQILYFLIKNSYRLLFLLLLGISLTLTIKSHSFHRSEYINSANAITGGIYENINSSREYLSLKKQNEILAEENARLKASLFNKKDTVIAQKSVLTTGIDSLQFNVTKGKVIKNMFNTRENYLTLNIGKKDGIKTDMGVINEKGIIGIIEKTSNHYATALSVLNTKSRINAKVKNSNHFGTLVWDGKNVGFVQLVDVPRLAKLHKGDSIVTGADSEIFPENIPIGKIESAFVNQETNYYTINIRLFNDMTDLGYVSVISNKLKEEKNNLEQQTVEN